MIKHWEWHLNLSCLLSWKRLSLFLELDSDTTRWAVDKRVIVPHNSHEKPKMAVISMIIEQWTRSILPPCPIYGMWGSRKTSWDGPANKKKKKFIMSKYSFLNMGLSRILFRLFRHFLIPISITISIQVEKA